MKRIFAVLAATSALISTSAFADDFSGPRVGVEVGLVDDEFAGSGDKSYAANVGYDYDLGSSVIGVTGTYSRLFNDGNTNFRELAISARGGMKVTPSTLLYATAGYSNLDAKNLPGSVDGGKWGLGLEQKFGQNLFANVETRYGNYAYGIELYQTVVGVGFRF